VRFSGAWRGPNLRPRNGGWVGAPRVTRFWQQFRSPRGIGAGISELLALLLGVLELRAFLFVSLTHAASEAVQSTMAAIALALLGGTIIAMRWGNLVWLLVAWAFVLGIEFSSALTLANNVMSSVHQSNALIAAIAVNFEVPLAVIGFSIAVLVAVSGANRRATTNK
jgi:hypothetical protein